MSQNDNIRKRKIKITNHINNLIQYFYIIGIDESTIFSKELYSSETNHLKPKVISKYPNIDLPYLSIPDDIIASHCFPKDIEVQEKNSDDKVVNEYFLFSLENPNPITSQNSARYNKVYFSCFLFHEPITYFHQYYQMKTGEYTVDTTVNKFLPKVICICSFLPLYHDFMKILASLRTYVLESPNLVNFYPIEKIIESLVYDIPSPTRGGKIHFEFLDGKKMIFEQTRPNDIPNPELDLNILTKRFKIEQIFQVMKCVLLELPIFFFCENKMHLTNTVESFATLIYPFEYPHSVIAILPKAYYSLVQSTQTFLIGINERYKDDFFETNNIEIGNKIAIIVEMSDRGVILHQYKPKEDKPIIKSKKIFSYSYPEDIFNKYNLPFHYTEKTMKNIKALLVPIMQSRTSNDLSTMTRFSNQSDRDSIVEKVDEKNNKQLFIYNLRQQFYTFFVSIMLYYQDYVIPSEDVKLSHFIEFQKKSLKINDILKVKKFIQVIPKLDRDFFKKFIDTRIFYNFLTKKLFPQNLQDKLDILLFDEKINQKLNKKLAFQFKKKSTPFLSYEGFHPEIIQIKINIPPFTQEESNYLLSESGRAKIVKYYQNLSLEQMDQGDEKKIKIIYNVFPRLLNDSEYFSGDAEDDIYNAINRSILPSVDDSATEFIEVANKVISKTEVTENYLSTHYNIDQYKLFDISKAERMNMIWLKLVAGTFWDMNKKDKEKKFEEIMSLLSKDLYIERNIYLSIFQSLLKYGTVQMCMRFFVLAWPKTYTNFLCLRDKIIREKNQLKNEQKFEIGFGDLEQMSNMEDEESDKKINNFVFVSKQKCSCCNAEMFYYDTVKKKLCINDLNRDYCTIQCPYCQKENPVAITVVVINKKTNLFRKLTFKLMTLSTIYEDDWLEDKIVRDHYYRENFARYWSIMWYCSSKFPMMFLLEKVNINPPLKISSRQCDYSYLPLQKEDDVIFETEENYDLSSNQNNFFDYKAQTSDDFPMKKNSFYGTKPDFVTFNYPIMKSMSNGCNEMKFQRRVKKINSVKEGVDMKKRLYRRGIHQSLDFDNTVPFESTFSNQSNKK